MTLTKSRGRSKPTSRNRPPKSAEQDDPEQSRLFIEKAREVGADGKWSEADAILKRLASKPPEPHKR
jgi:hypothetical protein